MGAHKWTQLACKNRGLRSQAFDSKIKTNNLARAKQAAMQDNGVIIILIEGSGYRVPKEIIIKFLSIYGTVTSNVVEQLFVDGSDPYAGIDGTNGTGTWWSDFCVTLILGRHINIQYPGIQKLCINCFGNHLKQVCKSKKLQRPQYVHKFTA
jgi:hypothetical protein